VLYPLTFGVAWLTVTNVVPVSWYLPILWLGPAPMVAEWVADITKRSRYSPSRQVVVTVPAGIASGVALGLHLRERFDSRALVPMLVYAAVGFLAAGLVATLQRSQGDVHWESEFERAEEARLESLRAVAGLKAATQPGSVTKSISDSTAPTSDGSRSL
jgi:hypothetical protein